VDSDGNITLLYINQVHVQGLTPAQAAAVIRGIPASNGKPATGLSQFYVRPQVVVAITDNGGIGVEVTGLVSAPRHYSVHSQSHLNDVLQQAVPALNSDLSKVEITHSLSQTKDIVDYRSYLDSQAASGNPVLQDGDIINVSSHEPLPIYVSVQGQVLTPKRYQVPAGTTAYSALQEAGGPTTSANMNEVVIKHFGTTDTIPFKYELAGENLTDTTINPILQDGDTIIVPASAMTSTYTITGSGIRNPAEYPLPNGAPITLAQAFGKAGGLSDRAKVKEIQIIRASTKGPGVQTIKLDASDPNVQGTYLVQPGDNITIGQGNPPAKTDIFSLLGLALAVIGLAH
jgi:protein involved in polysaccharide export with SLBB domain